MIKEVLFLNFYDRFYQFVKSDISHIKQNINIIYLHISIHLPKVVDSYLLLNAIHFFKYFMDLKMRIFKYISKYIFFKNKC